MDIGKQFKDSDSLILNKTNFCYNSKPSLFTKMHFEFEWTSLKLNRCPLSTLFFYFNLLHFLILNVQLYGYFNQTFGSSKVCQYVMPDFSHFYSPFKIAMIIEKN